MPPTGRDTETLSISARQDDRELACLPLGCQESLAIRALALSTPPQGRSPGPLH